MIRIMLHNDFEEDKLLSFKDSKRMVESYWEYCHGECCGCNVPHLQKETWFMECHDEHDDDETTCDTFEWVYYYEVFGMVIN